MNLCSKKKKSTVECLFAIPEAQHHSMFTLYAAQTQVLPAEISPNQILPPDHYMF